MEFSRICNNRHYIWNRNYSGKTYILSKFYSILKIYTNYKIYLQVAATMLGRSNYKKLSEDSKSEFSPSTVVLIDKEEEQITGSKDRLESWETQDPVLEMVGPGSFGIYKPPKYFGFSGMKSKSLILRYFTLSENEHSSSDEYPAHAFAVSEESDDTENLLSENEMLKEELKKMQETLKNLDRRVYDGLHISQSKRKRDDGDDGTDEAGPSTTHKKDDGNQSDKVRQKHTKMH